jgi:exosortase/archaeosortase family protein
VSRHVSFRFVVTLAVFAGVTFVVFRDTVMGPVLVPLRSLTAQITLALIRLAGMEAVREASIISHPNGFAYEISRGCTGLVGAALLAIAISAYPAARRSKLIGILVCVPTFAVINLVRLVHLFYLGVYQPQLFHTAHAVVWQLGMMAAVFGLWLGWTVRAGRRGSVEA